MKRILSYIVIPLLLSGFQSAAAFEHFTSGRIEGNAPMSIDGDFADWDGFSVIPIPISQVNSLSQNGLPRNANDLTASFRCVSDDTALYIAVNVTDDILTFGEEPAGIPFLDDCVEMLFYSSQPGLSPLKIWVSGDKNGGVRLEGREPMENKSYPFIWSKRGILAALKKNDAGYHVEVMIPKSVLALAGWGSGEAVRMNMGVYDDDNGGTFESIIQWADIPALGYNEIGFDEILYTMVTNDASPVITQELEIEISSSGQTPEAVDPDVQYDLGMAFERAGLYAEAIAELQKAVDTVPEGELKNKIHLTLARNYFFLGEYDKAKPICEELLRIESDSQRILNANMILLSVDRKQSGFMDQ